MIDELMDAIAARRTLPLAGFETWLRARDPDADADLHPVIVALAPGESNDLAELCACHGIVRIDRFDRQLLDLASVRLPAGSAEAHRRFADDLVAEAGDAGACGAWVCLPWRARMVHLLGPDEYHEVITNRNRDKITAAEQAALRTKTIGVMGLSVGGEAAVTVAQEHLCGHIVLADFDRLDLSNLNRLDAGFDELGVAKTTIAARRIARIDPWLKVTVFAEGVTAENAGRFLRGLDLLIEECDALDLKYRIRELARALSLDIVFAGDERGFLSVEPHGSNATLPIFHGRVAGPPPTREAFASARAFYEELCTWLGGWERLSVRSRDSLGRVGDTLCGYPQLASEARFAAGQVGHVVRRILLGERVSPFIGHIDLEEILMAEVGE